MNVDGVQRKFSFNLPPHFPSARRSQTMALSLFSNRGQSEEMRTKPTTPFSTCFSHIARYASSSEFDGMKNCSVVKAGTSFFSVQEFFRFQKRFSGKIFLQSLHFITHTHTHTHGANKRDNLISFYRSFPPKK